ncbi:unnamed protein product [Prorocentrum cordatum]|uniref:Uncharacterized protein n=1 Tax=Prorocentrum cordatum TaxID=2364126 RepID=A0ABN9VEG6_9DINO|nr:unnamed protein product [Polarella glacialis]
MPCGTGPLCLRTSLGQLPTVARWGPEASAAMAAAARSARSLGICARGSCRVGAPTSALAAARALRGEVPEALATRRGDLEGAEWWERHEGLFAQARREWGALCPDVYHLAPPGTCRRPPGHPAHSPPLAGCAPPPATRCWTARRPRSARCCGRCVPTAPGWRCTSWTSSRVLRRAARRDRPPGGQRHPPAAPQRHEPLRGHPVSAGVPGGPARPGHAMVVAPLAAELWPEWAGEGDCEETYGFVVRYRLGEDVDLAEHSDTANVTLNLCLGRAFEGGDLYFKGCRFTPSDADAEERPVPHQRGAALLHLWRKKKLRLRNFMPGRFLLLRPRRPYPRRAPADRGGALEPDPLGHRRGRRGAHPAVHAPRWGVAAARLARMRPGRPRGLRASARRLSRCRRPRAASASRGEVARARASQAEGLLWQAWAWEPLAVGIVQDEMVQPKPSCQKRAECSKHVLSNDA